MKVILKERLEFGDPAILDASVQFLQALYPPNALPPLQQFGSSLSKK